MSRFLVQKTALRHRKHNHGAESLSITESARTTRFPHAIPLSYGIPVRKNETLASKNLKTIKNVLCYPHGSDREEYEPPVVTDIEPITVIMGSNDPLPLSPLGDEDL